MRYRAFLAAIDDYGNPRNNLPSCINDLKYFSQLLRGALKVPDEKIRTLVDGQATVEAVQSGLEWLTRDVADDERLLFFYSGHGCQIPGGNGSIDEALVLAGDKFFLDDTLVACSRAAKPGTLTVLLDCCFGGGNDKVFMPAGDFGSFITPKRWSPPDDVLEKSIQLAKVESVPVSSYKPFGSLPVSSKAAPSVVLSASGSTPWPTAVDEAGQASVNGALLAACLEDETASASTGQTQGLSAFTFAVKRLVEQQGLDLSLRQVQDGTDRILKGLGFRQTSTLKVGTGPIDRDSRFLSLERRALAPFTDRRIDMADPKFLELLVPTIVDRVVGELTRKGHAPSVPGSEKFGWEILIPPLLNRVMDELTKKGYAPAIGASSKFFPGSDIIVRELIDRGIRELTKEHQAPNSGAGKFVGGVDVERFVRDALTRAGGGAKATAGSDKFLGDIVRDVVERGVREAIERGVHELTKDHQPPAAGADKFFPGAEIIIPIVVDRIVDHLSR